MKKIILITGSTDGIGLETAKLLAAKGHDILLHGRNSEKLAKAQSTVFGKSSSSQVEGYLADLSNLLGVESLAKSIIDKHEKIDVIINNAGIYKTPEPITKDGLDVRFVVNTIAPYLLTQRLMPLLGRSARVINLSSAAQAAVNPKALAGQVTLSDDFEVYAQSKLALTMWSRNMALSLKGKGPIIVAINPGSLLATKMVKQGFGVAGNDIRVGADILVRAAISDEFAKFTGQYFDNDAGQFTSPHRDALDSRKCNQIVEAIEIVVANLLGV